jgi:hypothetical protein
MFDSSSSGNSSPQRAIGAYSEKDSPMSSRGDTKPCIYSGCSGTMQFASEPVKGRGGAHEWVCSTTAKHVHRPVASRDSDVRPTRVDDESK